MNKLSVTQKEAITVEVKIDKVSLIINLEEKAEFSAILCFITSFAGEHGHKFQKKAYYTECKVPLDAKCSMYCRAGSSHGKLYAKFDFNASKLSSEGWDKLYTYFSIMFEYGYHTFYKKCRISRLEIAVDVPHVELTQLHFIDTRLKAICTKWLNEGTLYLGAKGSPIHWTIYDKKKELQQKHNQVLEYELLRIEVRLEPKSMRLAELSNMKKNPFSQLRVSSVESLMKTNGNATWKKFVQAIVCSNCLAQAAYLQLSPDEKLGIEMSSLKSNVSWWNQTKIWSSALEATQILCPPSEIY